MRKFYVIDGNAYIHRAYHALPPLNTSDGTQVNAVYGFIKLLLKIKNTFKPDYIAVCFDYPAKNFRHEIFTEYKAHRKPLDEALISQMPLAREAVKALNIAEIEIKGYEADDLIASVVENNRKNDIYTVIVTGDKDILQLVKDDVVAVWNDSKDIMYDEEAVDKKFGVAPSQLIDIFSLMGDSSDNVPGVKGIGEKTALKLVKEFGSMEAILKNAAVIPGKTGILIQNGVQDALMSKKLIELNKEVPLNYELENFGIKDLDTNIALPFFEKYEFKSLIKQLQITNYELRINDENQIENRQKSEVAESIDSASAISPQNDRGRPTSVITDFKSEIIDTKEEALLLAKEIEKEGRVTLKTVGTTGDSLKTGIVGASFYVSGKNVYIPIGHNDFTVKQITPEDFIDVFSGILASYKVKKIGYDLKEERNIYHSLGISLNGISFDVMLASYCLNPSKSHDIKDMAEEYFGFTAGDDSYLGKASKRISFADSDVNETAKYANSIVCASHNLYKLFEEKIKQHKLEPLFFDIEMPLIEILSEMEIAGIQIDTDFLKTFSEKIVSSIKDIEKNIYNMAGTEFNINSPKQLSHIMFEKLNLPVIKKTKTGNSTDEEVLTELSSYEFAAEVLKYRELQKIKSTYTEPITQYCAYYGDRIHTIFNQAVTATGRLSSTEPNLQNIPIKSEYGREFRKAFIAEKGKILISADYSQIDLRVLAHISQDEKLIEAFKAGEDIHSATAREVFNVSKGETVPDDLRSAAKAINFGIVYGMSPFGLSRQLNIPFGKAKEYIDGYFERYKGVKKWMSAVVEQAKHDGFVCTITGRKRYVPELKSGNNQVRAAGERIALNTPVQGTSADIIKIAMINIYNEIKVKKYPALMLLQVHDDLLFEVEEQAKDEFAAFVKEKMESALKFSVPLSVDVKSGKNWGEMTKVRS
ncbi:MAG: DNA polymerase I [Endomicrobia bacterium]|nr:DNA polymerase I [Endomicrobiia bacterium]MCL2506474.1 DNA polymerase I [Endomicrobiia bacterium]